MQPVALPIYLLIDDREEGPFEEQEVDELLEDQRITPAHYGFCEGMPGWRSVLEALVWARAPLFWNCRAQIELGVGEIVAGRRSVRDIRADLHPLLLRDGVLTNHSTVTRFDPLGAIIRINIDLRRGYTQWMQRSDFAVLDAWPAAELYEQVQGEIPRDWAAVWTEAGGQLFGERMIALKTDPIWTALSDFGVPYPAYSVGGEMWVRDVTRQDAQALGLVDAETGLDLLPPSPPPWVLLGEP